MKSPREQDFEIVTSDAGVQVIFSPTRSEFSYYHLVDADDVAQHGPVSLSYVRRGGPTGDTGDYVEQEVRAMADRLAADAAERRRAGR
jgi:hypothetical protein